MVIKNKATVMKWSWSNCFSQSISRLYIIWTVLYTQFHGCLCSCISQIMRNGTVYIQNWPMSCYTNLFMYIFQSLTDCLLANMHSNRTCWQHLGLYQFCLRFVHSIFWHSHQLSGLAIYCMFWLYKTSAEAWWRIKWFEVCDMEWVERSPSFGIDCLA